MEKKRQFRLMELIHMTFVEFNCSVNNAVTIVETV